MPKQAHIRPLTRGFLAGAMDRSSPSGRGAGTSFTFKRMSTRGSTSSPRSSSVQGRGPGRARVRGMGPPRRLSTSLARASADSDSEAYDPPPVRNHPMALLAAMEIAIGNYSPGGLPDSRGLGQPQHLIPHSEVASQEMDLATTDEEEEVVLVSASTHSTPLLEDTRLALETATDEEESPQSEDEKVLPPATSQGSFVIKSPAASQCLDGSTTVDEPDMEATSSDDQEDGDQASTSLHSAPASSGIEGPKVVNATRNDTGSLREEIEQNLTSGQVATGLHTTVTLYPHEDSPVAEERMAPMEQPASTAANDEVRVDTTPLPPAPTEVEGNPSPAMTVPATTEVRLPNAHILKGITDAPTGNHTSGPDTGGRSLELRRGG